jgi:hypothetical protein
LQQLIIQLIILRSLCSQQAAIRVKGFLVTAYEPARRSFAAGDRFGQSKSTESRYKSRQCCSNYRDSRFTAFGLGK